MHRSCLPDILDFRIEIFWSLDPAAFRLSVLMRATSFLSAAAKSSISVGCHSVDSMSANSNSVGEMY